MSKKHISNRLPTGKDGQRPTKKQWKKWAKKTGVNVVHIGLPNIKLGDIAMPNPQSPLPVTPRLLLDEYPRYAAEAKARLGDHFKEQSSARVEQTECDCDTFTVSTRVGNYTFHDPRSAYTFAETVPCEAEVHHSNTYQHINDATADFWSKL